jgi:selenide,water dikinase
MQLNKAGELFGKLDYIEAMTDVTGFGLLGHLIEMCEGSDVSADIMFDQVPVIDRQILDYYLEQKSIPGGTNRNFASYGHKIAPLTDVQKAILCDPQTSGGLLVAVRAGHEVEFESFAQAAGMTLKPFGRLIPRKEFAVYVHA